MLGSIFKLLAESLGLIKKIQDDKNTPEMKKAKEIQEELAKQDKTKESIINEDLEKIRREVG